MGVTGVREAKSFYAGQTDNAARKRTEEMNKRGKGEDQKPLRSVSASDLNLLGKDPVMEKKLQAQKKAMELVMNKFETDRKDDEEIALRDENIKKLDEEIGKAQEEINGIHERQEKLKEEYGVADGSKEAEDLEFRRAMIAKEKKMEPLTKEEQARLNEMGEPTEYQQRALEMDERVSHLEGIKEDAVKQRMKEEGARNSIHDMRLRDHKMVDSQKAAEDIIQNSSKEIVGMLVDESKEHIDKEQEEKEEAAREEAEKREGQTSEASPLKPDATTEYMNEIQKADTTQDKMEDEINTILKSKKLLEEDLKGITVDKQL